MKDLLSHAVAGAALSFEQTVDAFDKIMTGEATPAQVGALLAVIQQRGPSVDEIAGAASVMRDKVVCVGVPSGMRVIDTCGTGGDHSGTFNISTAAALVAAAAGRPHGVGVAKHGNRSITSKSGSSQVLEALGVNLQITPDKLTECLSEAGICFCFAPAHHPAMKHAMPIRLDLGFRTVFNVLGPLTNPAGAKAQVIGVFDPRLTEPMAQVLARLGSTHAMVVHGRMGQADDAPGIDEISHAGPTRITELTADGHISTRTFQPADVGVNAGNPDELKVDGPDESAAMIKAVLAGEAGGPRDIVALNAGAALVVADIAGDLMQGYALACRAIDEGQAQKTLDALVRCTNAA